jgi:ABC-type lipoprotein release transport system permease subunit
MERLRQDFVHSVRRLARMPGFVLRFCTSFLYGISAHDPATFAVTPLFLSGVALPACAVPARRAARVDPVEALRRESRAAASRWCEFVDAG